ncbi:hypothetical protein, partial [Roseomonas rosulenta]|uniref:hypothetical protein n=1 Tax=Roseomonas rosulenta TaxID=2748667 RepID=UPI001E3008F8
CALAAGAIAAARSVRHVRPLTPAAMRARAVATAQQLLARPADRSRIGAGMLNLQRLIALP